MTKPPPREPPNSQDSEMMVLGCMLTSTNSLHIVAEALDSSDFYYTEHKIIFDAIKSICQRGKPADVHIVSEELKRQDKLKAVGGISYLTTLAQYAGTSAHIEEYVETVREKSSLRQAIFVAQEIANNALDCPKDVAKFLIEFQDKINKIRRYGSLDNRFPIKFLNQFPVNFLLSTPPEKQMLLEYVDEKGNRQGFLPKEIVVMLVGAGGSGKTHLIAQLLLSIAFGMPFLEEIKPTKYCGTNNCGNVFLGVGENKCEDIHRLLHKSVTNLRKKYPDKLSEENIEEGTKRIAVFSFNGQNASFLEDKRPSRYFFELKMQLTNLAPPEGWSLIILDPVSRLLGADAETDNAAATQFIALLEQLTIDLPGNPTVLFVHHVSKAALKDGENQNQAAARGSSALTDGVREQLNLAKCQENVSVIRMSKSNFTAIMSAMYVEKGPDGFVTRCDEPAENSKKTQKKSKRGSFNDYYENDA